MCRQHPPHLTTTAFPRSAAASPSDSPGDQPPAQWEAWATAQLERERALGLAEYGDLKDTLLQRLQRVSALLALYLLLVSSGEVCTDWCLVYWGVRWC